MFKQVKSAFFWYYLYKFRRRVILIVLLLIMALFANAIYSDLVEYLKIKNKLDFLEIALLFKWSLIIFNVVFSVYLFLTMFKRDDEIKVKNENIKEEKNIFKKEKKQEVRKEKFTDREKKFLYKKKLKNKADTLVEK